MLSERGVARNRPEGRDVRESSPALGTNMLPLPRRFYVRGAAEVARDLLGCILAHRRGGEILAGRIVEAEAYVGEADRASHAHCGKTARNAAMYGEPGHAYVYFIYGM